MRLIIQCTTLLSLVLSAVGEGVRVANSHRRLESSNMTLSKENYKFGETIKVDFVNGESMKANSYPYFAIFSDTDSTYTSLDEVPSFEYFLAWQNDCGGQDDCESVTEGSIEFSAKDPKEAYYYYTYYESAYYNYTYTYTTGYGYFPFRNGNYIMCFLNDVYDVEAVDDGAEAIDQQLITDCQRFSVDKPKKKMKKKAKVIAKRQLKVGQNFTATVKTPVAIPNAWVGIYKPVKGKAPTGKLDDKALYWGYLACDTQQGDQLETTNCAAKQKKNKVSLGAGHSNVDKPNIMWPQKKGKYFMCVNFHANKPYNQFKCSKKITVKP